MIIDGNRRWAKQLGFDSAAHGHRAGAAKMREFLKWCDDLGISVVTLYLLSSDNLTNRPSEELAELTKIIAKKGLHVNLAVGYGGRTEITDAMRSIVGAHLASGGVLEDLAETLTPDLIGAHLYTGGQPDPDLVIRTSGEQRISDFMLWQSAHSEFYFVEALGPDLRQVDFLRALRDFARRQRRFGG